MLKREEDFLKIKMLTKIKQIAKDVFKELGSGYEECIYEKAMEVALRLEKIPYENQRILPIFYKNFNIGQAKPDLVINDTKGKEKIVIELKAVAAKLGEKELTQLKKYLETLKLKKGILINFPQASKEKGGGEVEVKVVGDR